MQKPFTFFLFNLFLFFVSAPCLFSQEQNNSGNAAGGFIISNAGSPEQLNNALKQAISEYNQENASRQTCFTADLAGKLKEAVDKWVAQESQNKKAQLNQVIEQNWETLFRFGPWVHYDYYLKDYDFFVHDFDIVQTSSVFVPYRGILELREMLYVQRKSPANISYPRKYYYTVTIPLKIRFDYSNGQFVVGTVEEGNRSIEEDWPDEIVERIKYS